MRAFTCTLLSSLFHGFTHRTDDRDEIVAIIVTTGVPPFVQAMRKEGLRKAVSDVVEAAAMPAPKQFSMACPRS